jgi:hypothetical protein
VTWNRDSFGGFGSSVGLEVDLGAARVKLRIISENSEMQGEQFRADEIVAAFKAGWKPH